MGKELGSIIAILVPQKKKMLIDWHRKGVDMQVKIGDKIYDSNDQPIMLIFDKEERELIANMMDESNKFCSYPDESEWTSNGFEAIKRFMHIGHESEKGE